MTIEIRRTQAAEARAVANVVADALLSTRLTDAEWVPGAASWMDTDSIGAWDGERCVGHVGAFRFDTTVPGGRRLKTSGVTRVGVLPTHTRRGLQRSMMTELLTDVRADGAALASLRASEAVIYQRFGFEIAGEAAAVEVTPRDMRPLRSGLDATTRILAPDEVSAVIPALYDRCGRGRVGTVARPDFLWNRILGAVIDAKTPSFIAVHEDAGGVLDGYVHYDVQWVDQPRGPQSGADTVHDLFGADAAVERALWAYLIDVDLVGVWTARHRPIDEAIRFAAKDTRAYRLTRRWDEQWLRILDVATALAGRTYGAGDGSVTVRVDDPLFADNCGTWRINGTGAERADAAADLGASIGILSAAYLGGTSWRELADAGLVAVHRAEAVDVADLLFAQHPAPFCGTFF